MLVAVVFVNFLVDRQPAASADISDLVTLYASFDEEVSADFGGGDLQLRTRVNHPFEKGSYILEKGYPALVFGIAKQKGIIGGALDCKDVLDRRGRIFFAARGNIAYRTHGWGGAVSMWLNTNPNELLKTPFCDPVQITAKSAHDGGIWIDFPDTTPRDMRLGIFRGLDSGHKPLKESDPRATIVRLKGVPFESGEWHHVVFSWSNFDSGKSNASAQLFVDGTMIGEIRDRKIAMKWDIDHTGIYVAVNFIGWLDEFAVFKRPLTAAEIEHLRLNPSSLNGLKSSSMLNERRRAEDLALVQKSWSAQQSKPPTPPRFPFNSHAARQYQREYAKWAGLPIDLTTPTGIEMKLIPPGSFQMGSPSEQPGHGRGGFDETLHNVTLTVPFYLARYEVTVSQFQRFIGETKYVTDGERNGGGNAHDARAVWKHRSGTQWRSPGYAGPFLLLDSLPVVHVSHNDARQFCRWLDQQLGFGTNGPWHFDLPTEAQWEWSCRAGSATRFWWGDELDDTGRLLNVGDRFLTQVHAEWPRETMPTNDGRAFPSPVGSYGANAFGIHDMLGNVWEYCSTRYGPYPKTPVADPGNLDPKRGFAVRGGGWSNEPDDARCATRNADPPNFCHSNLGFRVALPLPQRRDK
jgi:formylglycine-generating enzyme required for sulfatase activity